MVITLVPKRAHDAQGKHCSPASGRERDGALPMQHCVYGLPEVFILLCGYLSGAGDGKSRKGAAIKDGEAGMGGQGSGEKEVP